MSGVPELPDRPEALLARIRARGRGRLRLLIFAVVTAGVFYLLFRRIDYANVLATLAGADFKWLVAAFALTFTFPLFSALRWRRMLLSLGHDVSFRDCVAMIMAAWPMGTITPSKAGDLMKAYYLKDRVPVGLVVGSVLAERVLDVLVLLALALGGCLAFERYRLALVAGLGLVGGLVVIVALVRFRLPLPARLRAKLDPVLESLRRLGRSPSLLLVVLLWTFLNWMASVVQTVFCYRALGIEVPLVFASGALPLAIFVGLLPLTLSGMGTRDAAIIALFACHAPQEVSLGVGLLYSLFGYWIPALVGLPFLHRVLPRSGSR